MVGWVIRLHPAASSCCGRSSRLLAGASLRGHAARRATRPPIARSRWCAIRSAAPTSCPSRALTGGTRRRHALLLLRERAAGRLCAAEAGARDAASSELRADIVEVGRRLYARGYTASNDGNISVRLDDRPPADDADQRLQGLHDARHDGRHRSRRARSSPASAIRRPRCRCTSRSTASGPTRSAVVHAHPPMATGFAVAGIPLDRAVLAEVVTTLGSIPIAEYAHAVDRGAARRRSRKYVKAHDGMLLANHGALTLGTDLFARVLQDGDDRALRADQPGGAAARRRAAAVARGSRSAAGAARHVRHRRRRRRSARTRRLGACGRSELPGCQTRPCARDATVARLVRRSPGGR